MKLSPRKGLLCLFSLILLLSACASKDTGITGKMVLAKCAGAQVATNCVAQSTFAGSMTIYIQKNDKLDKVKTVKTNGDGTFTVPLKPGTYFIHPENSGTFPKAADFRVVVTEGKLTDLTIYYDTGFREGSPPEGTP